jgi:hypothetical protein
VVAFEVHGQWYGYGVRIALLFFQNFVFDKCDSWRYINLFNIVVSGESHQEIIGIKIPEAMVLTGVVKFRGEMVRGNSALCTSHVQELSSLIIEKLSNQRWQHAKLRAAQSIKAKMKPYRATFQQAKCLAHQRTLSSIIKWHPARSEQHVEVNPDKQNKCVNSEVMRHGNDIFRRSSSARKCYVKYSKSREKPPSTVKPLFVKSGICQYQNNNAASMAGSINL